MRSYLIIGGISLLLHGLLSAAPIPQVPERLESFMQMHCYECHDAEDPKGQFDLTALPRDLKIRQAFEKWVSVYDRVLAGEMPPKKQARPDPTDFYDFINQLSGSLHQADEIRISTVGRATKRRLNRYEYENALRELLQSPNLEVRDSLPEDTPAHGYNKIGDALDMSYVQLSRYLDVAEFALRQTMAHQVEKPAPIKQKYYAWDERAFWNMIYLGPTSRSNFPLINYEIQEHIRAERITPPHDRPEAQKPYESILVMASNFEPINGQFSRFQAPHEGLYKLRLSAQSALISNGYDRVSDGLRPEPVGLFSYKHASKIRPLGVIEVQPQRSVIEIEAWLLEGESVRPDAQRLPRIRPPDFANPLGHPRGRPAVAFGWLEVEGPFYEEWPTAGHKVLFGDLPIETSGDDIVVLSEAPFVDSERLLTRFMERAYRRTVEAHEVEPILNVIHDALNQGYNFTEAMIAGYTGVLASPGFLYLEEEAGPLSAHAVAERLAFFLWNSPPDDALLAKAEDGNLLQPAVLRAETERLLNDPRSERFVNAFLDYWLDLRHIRKTAPDPVLYPDYQLDDRLEDSMLWETRLYFTELIKRDLGVRYVVDSDFTVLNERLAEHYRLNRGRTTQMQMVTLPADSSRGGLLTQASILKVTADGNNTSPVLRGVWIMERILGMHPQPPPPAIPGVEPDTSGATTIREQLALHSDSPSCISCHEKIDPVGFALESYDVMGGYRDYYRAIGDGEPIKGIGHNGLFFNFSRGQPVDPSGTLWDGRPFQDIHELKQLLVREEELLAKNMVYQLTTYATGAPVSFGDRPEVKEILKKSEHTGYGIRTLIHEIIQSELFLHK